MQQDNNPFLKTAREIFQTAFISFGIFLFVYVFLVQPHRVQGVSMLPNFDSGELLLTEKVSYRFSNPERGNVIVFRAPIARKVDFIKRIVGLPRETVEIENGVILINGRQYSVNYQVFGKTEGNKTITLGENEYFVLGDNRSSSSDSRSFGPIKKEAIRGKVWFVYWPIVKNENFAGIRFVSGSSSHENISN